MEKNIIIPEKIEVWKTSDGQLFEDEVNALEHQKQLIFDNNLKIIICEFGPIYEEESQIVYNFIHEYKFKLKELFDNLEPWKTKNI